VSTKNLTEGEFLEESEQELLDESAVNKDESVDEDIIEFVPSKTQMMKIFWSELVNGPSQEEKEDDTPDLLPQVELSSKKRRSKNAEPAPEEKDSEDFINEEIESIDWNEIVEFNVELPNELTALGCVSVVARHPAFRLLLKLAKWVPSIPIVSDELSNDGNLDVEAMNVFSYVIGKLEDGTVIVATVCCLI
jgi:hypothetical protein